MSFTNFYGNIQVSLCIIVYGIFFYNGIAITLSVIIFNDFGFVFPVFLFIKLGRTKYFETEIRI